MNILSSTTTPPGPSSSSADKSLKCDIYNGMAFGNAQELAEDNRKEHNI
jgi:hypothetical protein